MNSAAAIPDETKLRGLLDGTLSEAEQAEVLALVETQPHWQQALDRLAAGAQTWQAAAEHLHEPPLVTDAALRSAMAAVQEPTIATDHQPGVTSAKLDFLTPVDDPRYLGRFGEYLIEKVIGRGGFGIVLQAFDPPLRRIVAVKVLAPHLSSNAAACLRFSREAKAAAAVVHDHVITIHSVGDKPLPHLVMQLVAGQSLQEKLDKSGPLGIKEVLRIGMQTASGLAAAHKHGEVHRDIKPANILLENGVERVKITDFGLARAADDASMTQSGVVAGTPQYMSPEQARGDTVDARSDLFSLGSVLYAMCAGHPPFRATTTMGVLKRVCDDPPRPIREINPEVPDWLAAIIGKLMAKRPEDRFASATEVSELLGQCLSHVQQPSAMPLLQSRALAPRGPELPLNAAASSASADVAPTDDPLLARARRAVREPAIGLIIAGIVNAFSLAIALLILSNFLAHGIFIEARWLIPVIAFIGTSSGLMVFGGLKMLRLENRLLVTFAAITALLISPGCLVGFAMGLWALVVLSRRDVQRGFAVVARRHWSGVADAKAERPEEGEWSCRCLTCGYVAPAHKWGIVRIGAASRGKWTVLWCPLCRWLRWMSVERFSAKSLAPQKPPPPLEPAPSPASSSGGLGLALFLVFLVLAIPLTLLIAAGLGYFLMSSGSPPAVAGRPEEPPEPSAGLLFESPDSRFEVSIHRTRTPEGEYVVSSPHHAPRDQQFFLVPPGEYRAAVKADGIVVREDTFAVNAVDPPTKYKVEAGGTLRFIAEESDAKLSLVLNHITGQTIWDWPNRQSFVVPAGLVHVDLRRPVGNGSFHILTSNYFDIIPGQETVIRVREKGIELVTEGIDGDPVVAAERQAMETARKRYDAGIATKLELIEAQRNYQQARLEWATRNDRQALAISILEEMAAFAEESERIVTMIYERGSIPLQTLHEAKTAALKQRQQLQQAVADLKSAGTLPADYQMPPVKKDAGPLPNEQSAEKANTPPE